MVQVTSHSIAMVLITRQTPRAYIHQNHWRDAKEGLIAVCIARQHRDGLAGCLVGPLTKVIFECVKACDSSADVRCRPAHPLGGQNGPAYQRSNLGTGRGAFMSTLFSARCVLCERKVVFTTREHVLPCQVVDPRFVDSVNKDTQPWTD